MGDSVTVYIHAGPKEVYDVIADVTRIGEFSPETIGARWIDGATGPEVGARFRGQVRRNGRPPTYWTTCTVTAADPGREFAFTVALPGAKAVNTWRYRLQAVGSGTDVTESFELSDTALVRAYWMTIGPLRRRTNVRNMHDTLGRIKAVAEASGPGEARRAAPPAKRRKPAKRVRAPRQRRDR